ncbi:MAG: M18 family aminopeptidase [Ruminococcaceae bacterium]|nr:M18 family aminopeptidase [Oscillospiraceae bacterium]
MNQALFHYIAACPTAYHAVAYSAQLLQAAGYQHLPEGQLWDLQPGQGYYVTRNRSSLIAFRIPTGDLHSFQMTAAHTDSPCFKIKENPELPGSHYVQLSTEGYGGMIPDSWMDRPLSVAGRVTVRTPQGLAQHLVDLQEPCALIPHVAIHMDRKKDGGTEGYNMAVDLLPLWGQTGKSRSLRSRLAEQLTLPEEDILTTDLYLYNPQPGVSWGNFLSAPRLDDLQCAFSALTALLQAKPSATSLQVCCLFDNEEVGSQTKQGAASTFLMDVLERICLGLGQTRQQLLTALAHSLLVSCDNAHGLHPNHPEYADKNHTVCLNGGVVIKYNANQRYTSDAVSAGLFQLICQKAGVPVQHYANRADIVGGSTLGSIANTQVSVNTVDIGLAQLAMHSAYETAGSEDTAYMVQALTTFYESTFTAAEDGSYQLN